MLAGCKAESGDVWTKVGTRNTVRDLDALRSALGDEKLTYVGYSYGTTVGSSTAGCSPSASGRWCSTASRCRRSTRSSPPTSRRGLREELRRVPRRLRGAARLPLRGWRSAPGVRRAGRRARSRQRAPGRLHAPRLRRGHAPPAGHRRHRRALQRCGRRPLREGELDRARDGARPPLGATGSSSCTSATPSPAAATTAPGATCRTPTWPSTAPTSGFGPTTPTETTPSGRPGRGSSRCSAGSSRSARRAASASPRPRSPYTPRRRRPRRGPGGRGDRRDRRPGHALRPFRGAPRAAPRGVAGHLGERRPHRLRPRLGLPRRSRRRPTSRTSRSPRTACGARRDTRAAPPGGLRSLFTGGG